MKTIVLLYAETATFHHYSLRSLARAQHVRLVTSPRYWFCSQLVLIRESGERAKRDAGSASLSTRHRTTYLLINSRTWCLQVRCDGALGAAAGVRKMTQPRENNNRN